MYTRLVRFGLLAAVFFLPSCGAAGNIEPPEPRFLRTVHGDGYSLTIERDR